MTPDEAIEKLNRHYVLFLNVPRAELIDAARLGIEALKERELVRSLLLSREHFGDNRGNADVLTMLKQLLPSETEE